MYSMACVRHIQGLLLLFAVALPCMAQAPQSPNLEAQRAAMQKLSFLIGHWSGKATMLRPGGMTLEVIQTEDARNRIEP